VRDNRSQYYDSYKGRYSPFKIKSTKIMWALHISIEYIQVYLQTIYEIGIHDIGNYDITK